ncbi:hypothetical protein AGMMS49944_26910 [Spirochaetia bacterium]|nr:hypothetical protein AGMMS49944_26910 [Spirochaetia bacterium]
MKKRSVFKRFAAAAIALALMSGFIALGCDTGNNPKVSFQVTFVSNGGSAVPAVSVESGSTVTKPADPSRPGYTFDDWYKEAGYTNRWNFTTDTVTAATTLYAKWTIVSGNFEVTFDSKGGSAVSAVSVANNSTVTKPADPTRTGYTFAGWYKEAGYTNQWNFTTDTVTAATTLYAKWTLATYSITYTLNSGTNNGSNPATYTVESPAINLAAPSRSGYTFDGWFENSGFTGSAVTTIPANSTGNKTFYAKWTAVASGSVVVTFDSKGGTLVADASVVSGGTVTKPTDSTRTGYTFAGWYKEAGYTNQWNFTTDTVTAATTLYAKWTETGSLTITIETINGTVSVSGSDGVNSISKSGAGSKPTSLTLTTSGYNSIKWYVDGAVVTGQTGNSITLNASAYMVGWNHSVTFTGFKDGIAYSKELPFTVVK